MGAQLHREFELWQKKAERRGWAVPRGDAVTHEGWWEAWLRYWKQMESYERKQIVGRPVPPHRSA